MPKSSFDANPNDEDLDSDLDLIIDSDINEETEFDRTQTDPVNSDQYEHENRPDDREADESAQHNDCNDGMFVRFKKKGLHLVHMIVRSLIPKLPEIKNIDSLSKAAVICIT